MFTEISKINCFQKIEISIIIYISKSFFTENQNGPYGLYEQILKDGIGNYWPKKCVMDEKWNFGGVGKFKIHFWGPGRGFQGFYKTKNDFKNIWNYSLVIPVQFSYISYPSTNQ